MITTTSVTRPMRMRLTSSGWFPPTMRPDGRIVGFVPLRGLR